jgi:hypothetical protein
MRYLKDLLITDNFLIKGHASTGGQRLSTFLNNNRKPFLEMDEVTLIGHDSDESVLVPWMLVRTDSILLAHEIGEAGDEGLKGLAEQETDKVTVTVHFNGRTPLQLAGKVRKRALNSEASGHHDFIVVVEAKLQGLNFQTTPEYAVFGNLSYVIMNRNRVAFISP